MALLALLALIILGFKGQKVNGKGWDIQIDYKSNSKMTTI